MPSSNPVNNGCFTVSTSTKSQPCANCTGAQTNQGIQNWRRSVVWVRVSLELPRRASGANREMVLAEEVEWNPPHNWIDAIAPARKSKLLMQGSKDIPEAGWRRGDETSAPRGVYADPALPDQGSGPRVFHLPIWCRLTPLVSLGPREWPSGCHSETHRGLIKPRIRGIW